jgi:hypothetical protein
MPGRLLGRVSVEREVRMTATDELRRMLDELRKLAAKDDER